MFSTLEKELEEKTVNFVNDLTALSKLNSKLNSSKNNSLELMGELGFFNSKILRDRTEIIKKGENFNNTIKTALESLLLIKELKNYFGENTILIKIEDFIYLIKKYNLICREFSDYLGVVPDKNLQEIKNAKDKIENLSHNFISPSPLMLREYYNLNTYRITEIHTFRSSGDLRLSTKKFLKTLPFILIRESSQSYIKNYLRSYLPEKEVRKICDVTVHKVDSKMFIAAPRNEMKDAPRSIRFYRRPEDPFICSLTSRGVVIYSRWGKEAEDETLEKYNKLFSN